MTRRVLIVTRGALACTGLLLAGSLGTEASAGAQGVPADLPGITQNPDNTLPAAQRFVILPAFANEAVLDKKTGLVWEKSPQTTSARWSIARRTCAEEKCWRPERLAAAVPGRIGQSGRLHCRPSEFVSSTGASVSVCPIGGLLVVDETWRRSQGLMGCAFRFGWRFDFHQLGPQRPSLVCP